MVCQCWKHLRMLASHLANFLYVIKLLLTNQRISCKQQMVQRSGLVVSAYIHVAWLNDSGSNISWQRDKLFSCFDLSSVYSIFTIQLADPHIRDHLKMQNQNQMRSNLNKSQKAFCSQEKTCIHLSATYGVNWVHSLNVAPALEGVKRVFGFCTHPYAKSRSTMIKCSLSQVHWTPSIELYRAQTGLICAMIISICHSWSDCWVQFVLLTGA